jgi:hypothetical protein
MADIFVSDYIAKLALLEKAVGHKVSYRMLEPFPVEGLESANRYIEVQKAAKRIAEFVGLGQMIFLVESIPLGKQTSGRIELGSSSSEVFIELSPDLFAFPEAILATLSHEISHKFLEVNRVSWAEGLANHYHNEVLTDITAIFLGLGKLMMNGHNLQRTTIDGSRQVTRTQRVGYLDGSQLAFVYLFACHMRGIPAKEFEKGLSSSSLRLVTECGLQFASYFQSKFRDPREAEAICDQITFSMHDLKGRADQFVEAMREMRDELKQLERETLERAKAQTDAICSGLEKLESAEVDPCLMYISTLRHHLLFGGARNDLEKVSNEIDAATAQVCRARQHLASRKKTRQSFMRRVARLFLANS